MKLSNSYERLGDIFYETVLPEPVKDPNTFLWNRKLAEELLLSDSLDLSEKAMAQVFSGNTILSGTEPIALAYAGHQFGNFVPQLGDGRAHLLGEITDQFGQRKDVQLKGSGRTSFSRNGDGRYALGPAIREYIMSEAMDALGIPTTRSLVVITTGETVYREVPQPGAVLTRVAASHLRVGTFEYFAARQNHQALERLCDYAINRHYPDLQGCGEERFILFFEKVMKRQIALVVEWMRVGFIHGVMNTDNTAISGETIDYGPCAMMGVYSPNTVFSSIDRHGRYAFGNQPAIAQWNMVRFAETLLPLIDKNEKVAVDIARSYLDTFSGLFKEQYLKMMSRKIGIAELLPSDHQLIFRLLDLMEQKQLDYTHTFDRLTRSISSEATEKQIREELGDWYAEWLLRIGHVVDAEPQALMRRTNPVVIPRNYHMERVIQACLESGESTAAEAFLDALLSPYATSSKTRQYQHVPADADIGYQTFCGT
ncbi:MAG: YdiU family protein [Candidatus Thiodiazotropha sp. (ex Monitilora ramsayi)]|nr:YdiU family protein [Candidatus Thiodiazotropha sp. (ex Monitilora ramsayi)]